jgi:23S rRNA pseudouridine2605 synthase
VQPKVAHVSERIQKALANAGLGSRREIERWVAEGRITIDGRIAKLGDQVAGRQRVCVDGRPVRGFSPAKREPGFVAFYKPGAARGEDEAAELDLPRPKHGRWIDFAPLDAKTSGLLLLTTDGALAHRLMRPTALPEREFAVRLAGEVSPGQVARLVEGVDLEDGTFRIVSLEPAGGSATNVWYNLVLGEARHRGLRAAFAAVGLSVSRVIRIRYGPVQLGRLRRGKSRPLTSEEIDGLYALTGERSPRVAAKPARRPARRDRRKAS